MYYDVVIDEYSASRLGNNPTAKQLAQLDKELFVNYLISWDDLFDRSEVEFEGIEED